ncbi:UNKNOWN [Stylonychia lemnae]|uniref:Uncharacterized protein n=1 Tax=Stylonychia lemnae TaxID=5949 RepID=A0A078AQ59_STYLE|nr:UNKNOWN [Stylonychia lemnae]|eukprot:CDW83083.1 UNKNOWN [Stylonychia lemnae]
MPIKIIHRIKSKTIWISSKSSEDEESEDQSEKQNKKHLNKKLNSNSSNDEEDESNDESQIQSNRKQIQETDDDESESGITESERSKKQLKQQQKQIKKRKQSSSESSDNSQQSSSDAEEEDNSSKIKTQLQKPLKQNKSSSQSDSDEDEKSQFETRSEKSKIIKQNNNNKPSRQYTKLIESDDINVQYNDHYQSSKEKDLKILNLSEENKKFKLLYDQMIVENQGLEENILKLQNTIQNLHYDIKEQHIEISQLKNDLDDQEITIKQKDNEIAESQDTLLKQQKETINKIQKQLDDIQSSNQEKFLLIEKLQIQVKDKDQLIQNYKSQERQNIDQIQTLTIQNKRLNNDILAKNDELEERLEQFSLVLKQNESLKQQLKSIRLQYERFKTEKIQYFENEIFEKKSEIEVLREMARGSQLQVRVKEKEIQRLKIKVMQMEGNVLLSNINNNNYYSNTPASNNLSIRKGYQQLSQNNNSPSRYSNLAGNGNGVNSRNQIHVLKPINSGKLSSHINDSQEIIDRSYLDTSLNKSVLDISKSNNKSYKIRNIINNRKSVNVSQVKNRLNENIQINSGENPKESSNLEYQQIDTTFMNESLQDLRSIQEQIPETNSFQDSAKSSSKKNDKY